MSNYPSSSYLSNLKASLGLYVPQNVKVEMKPKREQAIQEAYKGIFDVQYEGISAIKDIEISHLLGMNDVVVPFLVDEYKRLAVALKELDQCYKSLNQFSELKEVLDSIKVCFEISDLPNKLFKDLEKLSSDFEFSIDIKEQVKKMKAG